MRGSYRFHSWGTATALTRWKAWNGSEWIAITWIYVLRWRPSSLLKLPIGFWGERTTRNTRGKIEQRREENQQTQPTNGILYRNGTQATLVEGVCFHHHTNSAPQKIHQSSENEQHTYSPSFKRNGQWALQYLHHYTCNEAAKTSGLGAGLSVWSSRVQVLFTTGRSCSVRAQLLGY